MDILRLLLALVLLAGLALLYVYLNPPIQSEMTFSAPFERVFRATQSALHSAGFPARTANVDSGLIDTDWRPMGGNVRGRANVLIQRLSSNATKVSVNLIAERCELGQLICRPDSSFFKNSDYQELFQRIGLQLGIQVPVRKTPIDLSMGLKSGSAGFLALTGEQYFFRHFSFFLDGGLSSTRYGILGKIGGGFRWFPITHEQYLPFVEVYFSSMSREGVYWGRWVEFKMEDIGLGVGIEIRFGNWQITGEVGFVIASTRIEDLGQIGQSTMGALYGFGIGYKF